MSDKLPPSIFPARFQILSGSMLKLLACIAMLIDHTGAIILSHYPPALTELFYINGKGITFYRIVRDIGRCAFPIFCFLIVEGFLHTHDRRKYGRNLLLFALISEIPWNFMFSNTWHYLPLFPLICTMENAALSEEKPRSISFIYSIPYISQSL